MKLQKLFLQACCFFTIVSLVSMDTTAQTRTQPTAKPPTVNRMTPELLWKLGRLGDAIVSSDGNQIAYTVRRIELAEDKGKSSLYVRKQGSGETKVLLENWSSIGSLQWSQREGDGRLFFEGAPVAESEDAETPSTQAWSIDSAAGRSEN